MREEPLSTEALHERLLELHAPGQPNARWVHHGGHQRARNFAKYHGVFPSVLKPFLPAVEVCVGVGDESGAATHILHGNALDTRAAYGAEHTVSFAPMELSGRRGAEELALRDAPWTVACVSFAPPFAAAAVDEEWLQHHVVPKRSAALGAAKQHQHLLVCNIPECDLARGDVLLECDRARYAPAAAEAAGSARSESPFPLDGLSAFDHVCVGYFCFQQRAGRVEASALPAGREWALGDFARAAQLVPRGLAFSAVRRES